MRETKTDTYSLRASLLYSKLTTQDENLTHLDIINDANLMTAKEINAVINELRRDANELRQHAYDLLKWANILSDEVRKRAEELETKGKNDEHFTAT